MDLGTAADSDLESQLSLDWFAIGIRVPTEIFGSSDTVLKIQSVEAGALAVPPPTLTVTYDLEPTPTNVILEITRSHSGHILDNTDDNDCADGNLMSFTTAGVPFEPVFIKIQSGGINDCNVGMREWDVSSIPDNANIISVEWIATFHQNDPNQFPPVCDVVQLDTRPSTAGNAQSLLDEIIANPAFLNDATFCDSIGPAAASHLENVSLGNDWFAFAIKARPDTTQQVFHQSIYNDEQNNPTKLRISYSVP